MMHLCGWYESIPPSGAYQAMAAITDPVVFTRGDDLRAPEQMNRILGVTAIKSADSAFGDEAYLTSPFLLRRSPIHLPVIASGSEWHDPPQVQWVAAMPYRVAGNESLNFLTRQDTDAAAVANLGLIWLADAAVQPIEGDWITIGMSCPDTDATGKWLNVNPTWYSKLPYGDYRVGGLHVEGNNLAAARLVFPGASYRPGTIAMGTAGRSGMAAMRYGRAGELGRFNLNQPPTVDLLSFAAATSVNIYLDLLMLGGGAR